MATHADNVKFLRATVKHKGECSLVRKELQSVLKDRKLDWCGHHCILCNDCGLAENNVKWAKKWLSKNDIGAKLDLI